MAAYISRQYKKNILLATLATGLATAVSEAKNGPLPHGIGSQFSLGGAGSALAIEATNADANPAVLSRLDNHISAYLINLFQTQSVDSSQAPAGNPVGRQTNRLKNSPGGVFGGNYILNDKWAAGLATSGGSTNIKYNGSNINPAALVPPNGSFNNELVNVLMMVNPTIAYQRTPYDSYGFSVILGRQTMKANLANQQSAQTSGALRVDTATGVGARLGGLWKVSSLISLGGSASTPVKFSKFNKYGDIFPYSFDVPAMLRAGIAFHVGKTDYLFDLKQVYYSKVKALGTALGWKDQTIFMLGAQHQLTPSLVLSAGYNYGTSPVRNNNVLLNSFTVPIATNHLTAGVRYKLTPKWELTAAVEAALQRDIVDNGTGILGAKARGTRLGNRDMGILLGATCHFS